MVRYGIRPEQAERFRDKFIPIGRSLGIRFTRTTLADTDARPAIVDGSRTPVSAVVGPPRGGRMTLRQQYYP
jgi:hypothetical protein